MKRSESEPDRGEPREEAKSSRTGEGRTTSSESVAGVASVDSLHREVGNQAVQRLHESGALRTGPGTGRSSNGADERVDRNPTVEISHGISRTIQRQPGGGGGGSGSSSNVHIPDKQLQKKFKHADDFGVTGNWNKETKQKFREAIQNHLDDSETREIQGKYRGDDVVHYYNPSTGNNVIADTSGEFVSCWKLTEAQKQHLTDTGELGGG